MTQLPAVEVNGWRIREHDLEEQRAVHLALTRGSQTLDATLLAAAAEGLHPSDPDERLLVIGGDVGYGEPVVTGLLRLIVDNYRRGGTIPPADELQPGQQLASFAELPSPRQLSQFVRRTNAHGAAKRWAPDGIVPYLDLRGGEPDIITFGDFDIVRGVCTFAQRSY